MASSQRRYFTGPDQQLLPGRTVTFDIPRDIALHLESVIIDYSGTANITTPFAAATGIRRFGVVQNVEIVADSRTLISAPGHFFAQGQPGRNTSGSSSFVQPSPANGVTAFSGTYVVDFAAMDALNPKDSNLRSANYSQLQIRLTIGQLSDLYSGAVAGAGTITTLTGTVSSRGLIEEVAAGNGAVLTLPSLMRTATSQPGINISSAATAQEVVLSPGPELRGVYVAVYDGVTGEPLAVPGLRDFKIGTRNNVWMTQSEQTVRGMQTYDYETPLNVGVYILDFLKYGETPARHTELIPTAHLVELRLWLNSVGIANARADVVQMGYFRI